MVEAEFIGVEGFQSGTVLVGQTGETAGNTTNLGIVDDGVNGVF